MPHQQADIDQLAREDRLIQQLSQIRDALIEESGFDPLEDHRLDDDGCPNH